MERVIEPAMPADVEPIRVLLEHNRLPTDGVADRVATTLVVRDGGGVLGSAALEIHGRDALLRSVVVDGAARGQGLGHALTSAALDLARRHAIRDVYLLTETAADFFPRFGFRPVQREAVAEEVRRSVEFTSACAATAVPMVLRMGKDEMMKEDTITTGDARQITEAVQARYGDIALTVLSAQPSSCCTPQTQGQTGCCEPQVTTSCCSTASGDACCGTTAGDGITENLYQVDELEGLPLKAALASLGCGNPSALAELHTGEVVLDLGSGGGIDVLLSARRVGPTGFAYGLDMTDAMLDLARANAAEAGATNVQFLRGNIAAIPLPDNSVDVIISNCVINLAPDKAPVLEEAFRVLRPGGRFAVSDIVIHGGLPVDLVDTAEFRRDISSWSGCIAGALTDREYHDLLSSAGFQDIALEATRRYTLEQLGSTMPAWVQQLGEAKAREIVDRFSSSFIRATKPAA